MNKNILLCLFLIISVSNSCQKDKSLAPAGHSALQIQPVPKGVGVNIHFYEGNENDWSMIEASGLGIVRMDVSWGGIEKEPGKYDFSHLDQLIKQLEQRHIRLLFIIDYGNVLYDQGLAPYTEEGRVAYRRFCAELAGRYADKRIIWELWNEPNLDHFWMPNSRVEDYMTWCQAVVPVIRENDPDACIVGPAISSFDIPFLEACFERGLLTLIDGVTVHPYRNAWLAPESVLNEYEIVKIMIEQYRPSHKIIPLISGEWGYSTTYLSAEKQGDYLVRQWLTNLMAGIPVSIWYDWHDDGQDPENAEHNFGTVRWNYQPKPAYNGMSVLIRELAGHMPGPRISLARQEDYLVPFFSAEKVKLACWTTDSPHAIVLDSELKIVAGVSATDQIQKLSPGKSLMISGNPVFLKTEGVLPGWLVLLRTAFQKNTAGAVKSIQSFLNKNAEDQLALDIQKFLKSTNEQEKRIAYQSLYLLAAKLSQEPAMAMTVYQRILKDNRDVMTTKLVLNALARLCTAESLPSVEPFISDPQFMQEAANYYLSLAYKLVKEGKNAEAKYLLIEAARVSPNRYAVERVVKAMAKKGRGVEPEEQRKLSRRAGFVNQWWIAGPFPNEKDKAEKIAFFPEKQIDFSQKARFDSLTAQWEKVDLDGIYAILPLAEKYGKKQLAAYAYATLKMPESRDVILKIGSNDGVIGWVNGIKIHENIIARGLVVDEDEVKVRFRKGVNRVLLKVPNKGANWEVCLRVCDTINRPLDLNQYSINGE